jgi:hypothetical protein
MLNRLQISAQAIRRDLDAVSQAARKIADERLSGVSVS